MRGGGKSMLRDSSIGSEVIGNCVTPKQMSATEQAFNLARQNKNALFESINFLEEKLKPIVRPDIIAPDIAAGGESEKEAIESVVLVAKIREMAKDFAFFNKRIKSLIERLEI